jgi:hypothetical protein
VSFNPAALITCHSILCVTKSCVSLSILCVTQSCRTHHLPLNFVCHCQSCVSLNLVCHSILSILPHSSPATQFCVSLSILCVTQSCVSLNPAALITCHSFFCELAVGSDRRLAIYAYADDGPQPRFAAPHPSELTCVKFAYRYGFFCLVELDGNDQWHLCWLGLKDVCSPSICSTFYACAVVRLAPQLPNCVHATRLWKEKKIKR